MKNTKFRSFVCFLYLSIPLGSFAQGVPDKSIIQSYADFDNQLSIDSTLAFLTADALLAEVMALDVQNSFASEDFRADLRLSFAQSAIDYGAPYRAVAYLNGIDQLLPPTDIRVTRAFDLLDQAQQALGDQASAIQAALRAFNAAIARLGPENPALILRLDALEPRIEELSPAMLPQLRKMREDIEAANAGDPRVRAEGDPEAVTVWFGTNRKETSSIDPADQYGGEIGELSVGKLTVTIPPNHLSGRIEKPDGWFSSKHFDPKKHVVLASIEQMTRAAFAQGCCADTDKLLFVHGYNVTFHNGALRAAQLSFDLEFRGQMLYYSWPSKGTLLGYFQDSSSVANSRGAIMEYLSLATQGTGKLNIIAHSMGNRYLLDALAEFVTRNPDVRLGQLILAAPDVDRDQFVQRFNVIKSHADGVTLYASENDLALLVSKNVNGAPRAGDASGTPVLLAGLDTIDASNIAADSLGHSYFGQAPQVLGDILGLVRMGLGPSNRCSITPMSTDGELTVWNVMNDGCDFESLRTADDLIRLFGTDAPVQAQSRLENSGGEEEDFWRGVMALVDAQLELR